MGVFGVLALLLVVDSLSTFATWRSQWSRLEPSLADASTWRLPLLNPRGLGYLVAVAAAVGAAALSRWGDRRPGLGEITPAGDRAPGRLPLNTTAALAVLAHLSALAMVTVEVYAQGVIRDWGTGTSLAVTLTWTLFATAGLVVGIYYRSAELRILSLALFGVTTLKVFLYDVWRLDTTIRVFAFVGLGVALMVVSFLYRRFRQRIRAWIVPLTLLAALPLAGVAQPSRALGQESPEAEASRILLRRLRHRWPLQTSAADDSDAVLRITLPPDLYGIAQANLADLRILTEGEDGEDAKQIPYVLVRPSDQSQTTERAAPLFDLSQRGDDTEFLLDLSKAVEPVNQLRIEVDDKDRNYERSLHVFGANRRDAQAWNLLTDKGYLLDVTRPGRRLTVATVKFPQSRFPYYKIVIHNDGEKPLNIKGAKLLDHTQARAPRSEHRPEIVSQKQQAKEKQTVVVFDLTHERLPTVGLRVDVTFDEDYYRPVTLEVADPLGEDPLGKDVRWRRVASGQFYRLSRRGVQAEQTHLFYGEAAGRYLRLTIADGDDRPLTIDGCVVEEIEKYVAVRKAALDDVDGTVALYAGAPGLSAPRYDLARTLGDVSARELPELQLGPREANPLFRGPEPPVVPWSEQNKAMLWALTIGGVVILGLLTILLLRQAAKVSRQ